MVAAFDDDGNAELDVGEFSRLLNAMAEDMKLDFHELSEFLAFQLRCDQYDEGEDDDEFGDQRGGGGGGGGAGTAAISKEELAGRVHKHRELMAVLADQRMRDLYGMFDADGLSGEVDFRQVAGLMIQMTRDMGRKAREAMQVMLMMGRDERRTLNYEQFGRLIMAFAASAGKTFAAVAGDLTSAMKKNRRHTLDDYDLTVLGLMVNDNDPAFEEFDGFDPAFEEEKKDDNDVNTGTPGPGEEKLDALAARRLNGLFDLWDANGDGDLSVDELTEGLRRYQAVARGGAGKGGGGAGRLDAHVLLGFAENGFQSLDKRDFARAMVHFSRTNSVKLHELIDFMCMTPVLGADDFDHGGNNNANGGSATGGSRNIDSGFNDCQLAFNQTFFD
jgi:hypothetical protein